MSRKYVVPDKDGQYRGRVRPSERMFRRSRAAENRRRISQNKETRFMRFVFGLASVGTLIIFVIIYIINAAPKAHAAGVDNAVGDSLFTKPVLGDYSALDMMGLAFVIIAGYAVWRKYSNKD